MHCFDPKEKVDQMRLLDPVLTADQRRWLASMVYRMLTTVQEGLQMDSMAFRKTELRMQAVVPLLLVDRMRCW